MQKTFEQVTGKAANGFHQTDVPDLRGKTALVTGATVGIGYEVARALALAHARVLLVARKSDQGEDAMRAIKESQVKEGSGGGVADITFLECDLGDLESVKKLAETVQSREDRLDILICDAGVGTNKFDTAATGIDRHFSVNHLGHFYLVNQLLPLMRKTSELPDSLPPRVVVVSSELHRGAPPSTQFANVDELNDDSRSNLDSKLGIANALYARSKLANILFVKELVKRASLSSSSNSVVPGIYAIATHPGAVHTAQQDHFKEAYGGVFGTIMKSVTVPFMRSPEQGSLSTLWAATSDDVVKTSPNGDKGLDRGEGAGGWQGRYVTDPAQEGNESSQAQDTALGDRLWNLSENIVSEQLGGAALKSWTEGVIAA
ncbi:NAD-P-binding protein [Panus rudis PR-1116 ss-1]|nr:NAD-P-binding protein [Panus rudis PR-1116 ss-1]